MKAATNNDHDAALPGRSAQRDARRWIERQLRWERTLGSLRGQEHHPTRRAA